MPYGHDPEKLKQAIDDASKLIAELERKKVPVPPMIKKIVNAMREGKEIAISAEEASQHFARFINDMDAQCRMEEAAGGDDAYVCLAKRDPIDGSLSYRGRVNFVLNIDNPTSVINLYWTKKKRSGWACVWDELRNGTPSGLYGKCFAKPGSRAYIPRS
jgi:hypothetical protein